MFTVALLLQAASFLLETRAMAGDSTVQAVIDRQVVDSEGNLFLAPPERVVVLNWDLLEQILELGIVPVGAPNISGYRTWVRTPEVPSQVEDIGTRAEPNLEKLAALQPDVILAASPQKGLLKRLSTIAPVLYLPNYGKEEQAAEQAIAHFRTLARLFDRSAIAEEKLAAMAAGFQRLKKTLHDAFGGSPEVLVFRFSNLTTVFLFTENSSSDYVLKQLGLRNSMPQAAKPWGIIQKRLDSLQHVENGYVLYVHPFPAEKKMEKSVIWNAMPFVREHRVNAVSTVWSYGGAMSLNYLAKAYTQALLELAPEHATYQKQ